MRMSAPSATRRLRRTAAFSFITAMIVLGLGAGFPVVGHASGSVTEYPIPTSSSLPLGIATGSDGALWYTESSNSADKIGRVSTSGSFTEYPIPTSSSQPIGIAAGSDGALWVHRGQSIKRQQDWASDDLG